MPKELALQATSRPENLGCCVKSGDLDKLKSNDLKIARSQSFLASCSTAIHAAVLPGAERFGCEQAKWQGHHLGSQSQLLRLVWPSTIVIGRRLKSLNQNLGLMIPGCANDAA
ncbi:hypothetical protein PGT21_001878 [Puccinia graminis f. sp. tritici]|uniref:Uncharacterized protein n=1 Tax=Puccinia graminis f. sp. tritici TaxID=56615 RepID=A0A5B0N660_PUCGR|nr:hypothetical protein PGT21_001878 [Puccinia graminis f. sp. tritici]KAA1123397.1 hypothetical protein PGTUg99_019842 [Puccinia graminis f. sp. tritici]